MNLKKHEHLFNIIAPGYNWFFKSQVLNYTEILSRNIYKLGIPDNSRILDVGCGTGAFSQALVNRGFKVVGIDMAKKMINYGSKRGLDCRYGNIIDGLGFENKSFDLVVFAFVAHGLDSDKRNKLFQEAIRLWRMHNLIFYKKNICASRLGHIATIIVHHGIRTTLCLRFMLGHCANHV